MSQSVGQNAKPGRPKQSDIPVRIRRRQSDARWRANVASCFETLKNIIPVNKRASRRQISKAYILQETSKHLTFLEGILCTLLKEKGNFEGCQEQNDNAFIQQLQEIKDDFIVEQTDKLYSLNTGRKYKRNKHKIYASENLPNETHPGPVVPMPTRKAISLSGPTCFGAAPLDEAADSELGSPSFNLSRKQPPMRVIVRAARPIKLEQPIVHRCRIENMTIKDFTTVSPTEYHGRLCTPPLMVGHAPRKAAVVTGAAVKRGPPHVEKTTGKQRKRKKPRLSPIATHCHSLLTGSVGDDQVCSPTTTCRMPFSQFQAQCMSQEYITPADDVSPLEHNCVMVPQIGCLSGSLTNEQLAYDKDHEQLRPPTQALAMCDQDDSYQEKRVEHLFGCCGLEQEGEIELSLLEEKPQAGLQKQFIDLYDTRDVFDERLLPPLSEEKLPIQFTPAKQPPFTCGPHSTPKDTGQPDPYPPPLLSPLTQDPMWDRGVDYSPIKTYQDESKEKLTFTPVSLPKDWSLTPIAGCPPTPQDMSTPADATFPWAADRRLDCDEDISSGDEAQKPIPNSPSTSRSQSFYHRESKWCGMGNALLESGNGRKRKTATVKRYGNMKCRRSLNMSLDFEENSTTSEANPLLPASTEECLQDFDRYYEKLKETKVEPCSVHVKEEMDPVWELVNMPPFPGDNDEDARSHSKGWAWMEEHCVPIKDSNTLPSLEYLPLEEYALPHNLSVNTKTGGQVVPKLERTQPRSDDQPAWDERDTINDLQLVPSSLQASAADDANVTFNNCDGEYRLTMFTGLTSHQPGEITAPGDQPDNNDNMSEVTFPLADFMAYLRQQVLSADAAELDDQEETFSVPSMDERNDHKKQDFTSLSGIDNLDLADHMRLIEDAEASLHAQSRTEIESSA